jgi:hypothetical protein
MRACDNPFFERSGTNFRYEGGAQSEPLRTGLFLLVAGDEVEEESVVMRSRLVASL